MEPASIFVLVSVYVGLHTETFSLSAQFIPLSLSGTQTGSGNPTKTTADLPTLIVSCDIPVIVQQSELFNHGNADMQQIKEMNQSFPTCLLYSLFASKSQFNK